MQSTRVTQEHPVSGIMKLATAEQMQKLDQYAIQNYNIPSVKLMECAAATLAAAALDLLSKKSEKIITVQDRKQKSKKQDKKARVAVFCGTGNNGGDGLAAARILASKGMTVRVFLVGNPERMTPDSREMAKRLTARKIKLEVFDSANIEQKSWIKQADLCIDALFGVGLSRDIDPKSDFFAAIDWMNRSEGKILAADIPSGIDADSGCVRGCAVHADQTVTFTLPKAGQFISRGAIDTGKLLIRDIGIPRELVRAVTCRTFTTDRSFVMSALPKRKPDGHKGDFGRLLIVGGAVEYTGAPYMTALAAERSGCGLVHLGVPQRIYTIEAVRCVSTMPFPLPGKKSDSSARRLDNSAQQLDSGALPAILEKLTSCQALALGPGLGRGEDTERMVRELLARTKKPVVLDADGIRALAGHLDILNARKDSVTILTPHDGEFTAIGGDLSSGDRKKAAVDFATAHGCILILKGHRTIIVTPYGTAFINTTGNSGLAKGGSGDILTGIIASLLAQGATALQAAVCGVWIHGRAGDMAANQYSAYGMTPEDVIHALPQVFLELAREKHADY